MAQWQDLVAAPPGQPWQLTHPVNVYDSAALSVLATQAWAGRQLSFIDLPQTQLLYRTGLKIVLAEDHYPGWLALEDVRHLEPASAPYQPQKIDRADILRVIPRILDFCHTAQTRTHTYLWGGTLGPSYDCSGLVQASFASQGIWLPRDAYQQEAFSTPILNPGPTPDAILSQLQPGDLVFFGSSVKATHVGIYLGEGQYLHSSGLEQGRNGIGIDSLALQGITPPDPVSQAYYQQFRGAGRIMNHYY